MVTGTVHRRLDLLNTYKLPKLPGAQLRENKFEIEHTQRIKSGEEESDNLERRKARVTQLKMIEDLEKAPPGSKRWGLFNSKAGKK